MIQIIPSIFQSFLQDVINNEYDKMLLRMSVIILIASKSFHLGQQIITS